MSAPIQIVKLGMKVSAFRLGWVTVKYHDILIRCNVCLYKEEKLYIKMPEVFIKDVKFPFVSWDTQKASDYFQKEVLKALKISIGLNLNKAITMKRAWWNEKKKGDKNKKSI